MIDDETKVWKARNPIIMINYVLVIKKLELDLYDILK